MAGVGVRINSSGVTLRDLRFESRQSTVYGQPDRDEPYVIVASAGAFTGGLVEISSCRFGGEVGQDFRDQDPKVTLLPGPPRFAIEVGPTDNGEQVAGLHITGNWFFGRTGDGGPEESSALGAIRLREHLVDSVVMGNYFRPYFGPLIVEDNLPRQSDLARPNSFVANSVPPGGGSSSVFSRGGRNWRSFPDPVPPA
jgi:hypothetical protein